MIRYRLIVAVVVSLSFWPSVSHCEGAKKKAASASSNELSEVKQMVEEQSKQIQILSDQVAHLSQAIDALHAQLAASQATPSPAPHAAATPEVITPPVAAPVSTPAPAPAADSGAAHVVTKGETLTSIAKHYKTTVAELLKVNKIENDRMLQIGQTLVIPTPTSATAPAGTPQEKKENQ